MGRRSPEGPAVEVWKGPFEERTTVTRHDHGWAATYTYGGLKSSGDDPCEPRSVTRSWPGAATYIGFDAGSGQVRETWLYDDGPCVDSLVARGQAPPPAKELVEAAVEGWVATASRARRALKDAHAAEDVAQETVLRALQRPRPTGDPLGYLAGIGKNVTLETLRDRGRRGTSLDALVEQARRLRRPGSGLSDRPRPVGGTDRRAPSSVLSVAAAPQTGPDPVRRARAGGRRGGCAAGHDSGGGQERPHAGPSAAPRGALR
jgi:hypothetical protein